MASVTEYLERLQKLTQTNFKLLQALNDSFYTKNSHLVVNVDENKYIIPSFIQLENKINYLQENFENLVNAPKTGEASFNFDGNSQTIELRGFTCTPQKLSLEKPTNFEVENNNIFKDFLTPNPYVKFNLNTIPNDISEVVVKKIVPISDKMKSEFNGYLTKSDTPETSVEISYEDLYKKLSIYKKDIDYIEYDSIKSLPIRKSIGTGTYIIKSIDKNEILPNLTETYTLTISSPDMQNGELKYKLFDNVIEKYLQVGDELVTFDDSAKLRILEVRHNSHQLVLEVLNGDYLNLVADTGDDSAASDMSKLKFYSPVNFDNDKYINVSLEEDKYIAIFISPLNNRMNIRAPWGNGVILNTHSLTNFNNEKYIEYYEENVRNIGDILYELTQVSSNGITKYTKDEFNTFTTYKPSMKVDDLKVYQINSHLNNSPTIQKIRNLYSQKIQYNNELDDIQKNINELNSTLATIAFDDTTNIRSVYENKLTEFNKKRNTTLSSLNSIINEISMAANDSDVPIENAKYRIRGFFNINDDSSIAEFAKHINGIRVWYRYKNRDQETGNAHSIGKENIFSDWNEMPVNKRMRFAYISNNKYDYKYQEDNSKYNEPSFNQIDIPITQGECVDVKFQVIWDFGFPYIETTSSWSDVITIEFPEELKKNVQILDIIEENNSDIETNRFNNILIDNGVTTHIGDKLIDQDLTYFHQPEHISSGFYTSERRVIPLKDKLLDISNNISKLNDEVFGYSVNNLKINIYTDNIATVISPNQTNTVYLISGVNIANIQLTNTSNHTVKLYPILIGTRDKFIYDSNASNATDYNEFKIRNYNKGKKLESQRFNQYIYFRNKDAWTGESIPQPTDYMCPFIKSDYQLCVDSDSKFDYLEIKPQESVIVPIEFNFTNGKINGLILQFTLRTSLYTEPTSYEVKFETDSDNLTGKIKQTQTTTLSTDYKPIVKG